MAWTDDLTMASMGEPDSLPALFPLIDSVNHQPLTKITWQPGDHTLSAVSGETISAGGEVCNNYGPKSNEECMSPPYTHYLPPDNTLTTVQKC